MGPSNALPLEVPSVQAMNGRCAATKVVISLAPNRARLVSLTPPPRALTAQEVRTRRAEPLPLRWTLRLTSCCAQVGGDLLQCPFTRGAQRGNDAGPPAPNYLLADPQGLPWAKVQPQMLEDLWSYDAARTGQSRHKTPALS